MTPGNLRPAILAAFALVALVVAGGCRKPPGSIKTPNDAAAGPKGDPWEAAAKRLSKDADLKACKAALGGLNTEVAGRDDVSKPTGLSEDAVKTLDTLIPLTAEDRAEVMSASFTSYDSAYLAECLYLRDVAISLDANALPLERRADLGFAWVCRQVFVRPWTVPTAEGILTTALPPAYVLRRGSGSGLERMYVFLALAQQLGLDACLIGGPDSAGKPAWQVAMSADGKTVLTGAARGPFWAVGVRIGPDVRLYDPWRGVAFPATLSQLKANPDAHKAWFEDKANISGVTADDAKRVAVFLAVPVNSLAPRMALLEEKLKGEVKVKLAANPVAQRAAFPDPKPAYWNPRDDRFAYGRAARTFLPQEEGGADQSERGAGRLYEAYFAAQLPRADRVIPSELRENQQIVADVGERIGQYARVTYVVAFLDPPPTPREKLQRGLFGDAARDLVGRQDGFRRSAERLHQTPDAGKMIREWVAEAARLYRELGTNVATVAQDRAAIDAHWRAPAAQLLLDRAVSEVGEAEATYLLALCKHEQAERSQSRLDRAIGSDAEKRKGEVKDAWAEASRQWGTFNVFPAAQTGPADLAAHAAALSARARSMAGAK